MACDPPGNGNLWTIIALGRKVPFLLTFNKSKIHQPVSRLVGTSFEQGLGVSTWGEHKLVEIWYSLRCSSKPPNTSMISCLLLKTLWKLAAQNVVIISTT